MPCSGIRELPAGPIEFPELVYSFVICDEKIVMIDAGIPNSVMDVSLLDRIDYLILTHLHIDHVGLLQEIVSTYKPKIVVYNGYRKYLENPEMINESARQGLGELIDLYGEIKPIKGEILEVFGNEEIRIGKNVLKIFHTPGHSREHISIMVGHILFTGDSAGGRYNGVPFPTTPYGTELNQYMKSLEFQISLEPKIIGLSHGGLVNAIHLRQHYMQIVEGNYKVDIQLGGIKDEILRRFLKINYKGIEEKKE